MLPCSDSAGSKPRWTERLPVAFVFWYMPDSNDPQVVFFGVFTVVCVERGIFVTSALRAILQRLDESYGGLNAITL